MLTLLFLVAYINVCAQVSPAPNVKFTWEGSFTGNKAIWNVDDTLNVYQNVGGTNVTLKISDPFRQNTTTSNPSDYLDYTKTNTFFGRGALAFQITAERANQPVCLDFSFSKASLINAFNVWDIDMLQSNSNHFSTFQDSIQIFAYNDTGRVLMNLAYIDPSPVFTITGQGAKANFIANTNGDVLHNDPRGSLLVSSAIPIDRFSVCFSNGSEDDGLSNSQAVKITEFEFKEYLGSISGFVLENGSNMPLSGSLIRLLDINGSPVYNRNGVLMETTTGPDGSYNFQFLNLAYYRIQQTNPMGYDSHSDIQGPNDNLIEVTLTSGRGNSIQNNFYEVMSAPLAVKLENLSAKWDGKTQTLVEWQVNSEVNNSHFDVLLSSNGIDFRNMGSIKSIGPSSRKVNYDFRFENNIKGLSYIQLVQTDYDGSMTNLGIVSLESPQDFVQVLIAPNPVSDLFTIRYQLEKMEAVTYHLINAAGNTVKKGSLTPMIEGFFELDISNYPVGEYILQLISGEIRTTKRIIKL